MSLNHAHLKQAETLGRIMSLYGKKIEVTQFEDLKKSLGKNDKIYKEDIVKSYIADVNLNAQRNPEKADSILKAAHDELSTLQRVEVIENEKIATYYIKKSKEVEEKEEGKESEDKREEKKEEKPEEEEEDETEQGASLSKSQLAYDILKGGAHKKHKYLTIKDGKYIYDYDQMSSADHEEAAEHHADKIAYHYDSDFKANKSTGYNPEAHKQHKELKDKHEKLAKEKGGDYKITAALVDFLDKQQFNDEERSDAEYVSEKIDHYSENVGIKFSKQEKASLVKQYNAIKDQQKREKKWNFEDEKDDDYDEEEDAYNKEYQRRKKNLNKAETALDILKGGPGSGRKESLNKHKLLVAAHDQAKGIYDNFQKDPPKDHQGKVKYVEAENRLAQTKKELREHIEDHYNNHNELLDSNDHTLNQKMHDKFSIKKSEETEIEKGGGEGSRGGKVIGHTRSGKPIYANKHANEYSDFTHNDHIDAAYIHNELTKTGSGKQGNTEKHQHHRDMSASHSQASLKKNNVTGDDVDEAYAKYSRGEMDSDEVHKIHSKFKKSNSLNKAEDAIDILKGGEGSKGGHVIGHTKSGKPIYDSANHPSHSNFTKQDHLDAAEHHADHIREIHDNYAEHHIVGNVKDNLNRHNRNREHHEKMADTYFDQKGDLYGKDVADSVGKK